MPPVTAQTPSPSSAPRNVPASGPVEQYDGYRAYAIKDARCGKLIEAKDGSLISTTGTDAQGKYIGGYTVTAGRTDSYRSPGVELKSVAEVQKLLQLKPTSQFDPQGRQIYEREGFVGAYRISQDKDGSVIVHFSGGHHLSNPNKTMSAQTFHHGYWDMTRKNLAETTLPPVPSSLPKLPDGVGGSGTGAPGNGATGAGAPGTGAKGLGTTGTGTPGTAGPANDTKTAPGGTNPKPSPQPKPQEPAPKKAHSDSPAPAPLPVAPSPEPNNLEQLTMPPKPAPQNPAPPSPVAPKNEPPTPAPQNPAPSKTEPKKTEQSKAEPPPTQQIPKVEVKTEPDVNKVSLDGYGFWNFDLGSLLQSASPKPSDKKLETRKPEELLKEAKDKPTEPKAEKPKVQAPAPEPKKELPKKVLDEVTNLQSELKHYEEQRKQFAAARKSYLDSPEYVQAASEVSAAKQYAKELQDRQDGRGWYNPVGWFNYKLEWAYSDVAKKEQVFAKHLDVLSEMNRDESQFMHGQTHTKKRLEELRKLHPGVPFPGDK